MAATTNDEVTEVTTTAAHEEPAAEPGLLGTLGIEGKLFAAQLVNFAIVAFVLWQWAYKPLLKVMDERTKKIEQGLKDATASGAARKAAEEQGAAIVAEARRGAKEIMDQAAARGEAEQSQATERAKAEVARVVEQGREQIRAEKEKMVAEAKAEVGTLVALVAERVLKEKVDAAKDAKLVAAAIADIEKSV